ncbi:MAG: hypothetical protein H7Y09_15200 [Chitinophagaceae bacterium]|nr:hypothetical protein [Anaerolineae bacterium]
MDTPIVCNLNAIPADQRDSHAALAQEIFSQVQATIDLPDGYAFQLPFTLWEKIGRWLPFERLCCPFLNFALEVPTGEERIWLKLTGQEGVKALLKNEMSL